MLEMTKKSVKTLFVEYEKAVSISKEGRCANIEK